MNIFQITFINTMLVTFPLFLYLIYLKTNINISENQKKLYFILTVISSIFILYNYCFNTNEFLSILMLNSILLLLILEDYIIFFNIIIFIILTIFYFNYNSIFILIIFYIVFDLLYILKNKLKIEKILFIELYILISSSIYLIWIYKYNKIFFSNISIIENIICYIFISNIIYLLYTTGNSILNIHLKYKDLVHEKEIKTSLFKITHEIKNPIAVCKGYLDIMNINDQKQVKKYIPIIKSEIERLLVLLQDFLLINKNNLNMEVMDFNFLIEDVIKKINPLLEEKNIKLVLDIVDDEVFIKGDYNRLSQVLLNILKNSIEAIEKSGTIIIKSKFKKNKYIIEFIDDGIGMKKEELNRIRELFFTTKLKGSGLGTSLIYEIVEAHSGKVTYKSKYLKGTNVKLEFDVCDEY